MRRKIMNAAALVSLTTALLLISNKQTISQDIVMEQQTERVTSEYIPVKTYLSSQPEYTMHQLTMNQVNMYGFTDEEMDLLYRIVFAESGNQDEETIGYVTSVIINRINSDMFPDTLEEVVMQKNQFQVVDTGAYLSKIPDQKTIETVNKICFITGTTTEPDVLAFRNSYYHADYKEAFVSGDMYFSYL